MHRHSKAGPLLLICLTYKLLLAGWAPHGDGPSARARGGGGGGGAALGA